jgi:hypothetical protein
MSGGVVHAVQNPSSEKKSHSLSSLLNVGTIFCDSANRGGVVAISSQQIFQKMIFVQNDGTVGDSDIERYVITVVCRDGKGITGTGLSTKELYLSSEE